jgi:metallo-beta-lactamase class B
MPAAHPVRNIGQAQVTWVGDLDGSRGEVMPKVFSFAGLLACLALLAASVSNAADAAAPKPNLVAFTPFEVAPDVFYVGSQDQSSYVIRTEQGLILINSGYEESVPLIRQSIEKLGFKFSDIKVLLISHAHIDHDAGSAAIIEQTHARYEVMDADVPVVESGGKADFQNGKLPAEWYPPVHVDRVLHDTDRVKLGSADVWAYRTGGHTKGCTTYTLERRRVNLPPLNVVFLCGVAASAGPNGAYKLLDNRDYPNIRQDFEKSFATWASLPCDVFLGAHGRYFNLQEKYARLQAGDRNAFIDPQGYKNYIARAKQDYERILKQQLDAAGSAAK